MHAEMTSTAKRPFEWQTQPLASAVVYRLVDEFCVRSAAARQLAERMLRETGTRFTDWVDFVAPPTDEVDRDTLVGAGYHLQRAGRHTSGRASRRHVSNDPARWARLELGSESQVCHRPSHHQWNQRRGGGRCAVWRAADGAGRPGNGRRVVDRRAAWPVGIYTARRLGGGSERGAASR